jgi:ATP-dependent DNA helicase RecQ
MELKEQLNTYFQFDHFRPGQEETIASIMRGQHTISMLPTGTGKSLCYQLSGYLLDGQVLIVSPLLSLMQDQVDQMKMRGEKRVVAINSFLTNEEKKKVFQHLTYYKFIFISPEMLTSSYVLEALKRINITLFVVDEAHCISQWGYDFRPDYLKLGEVRSQLNKPLTLALTATATKEVFADIVQSLQLDDWKEVLFSVDRKNISLRIEHLSYYEEKMSRLAELVSYLQGPGIIYFSSKKMAEKTVHFLQEKGISRVMAYHAGLGSEDRILIQQQFIHNQLDLICATSAFGMGINKENIRYVIHFHMPLQLESYLQEIGRAGRDGLPSIAILLSAPGDEQLPIQLAEGELPSVVQIERIEQWLIDHSHVINKLDKYEEELKMIGGLTDVQFRLIKDYVLHSPAGALDTRMPLEEFKSLMEKRIHLKKEKIRTVSHWIHTSMCRREGILQYFGEERTVEVENCCDCCGIAMSDFREQVQGKAPSENRFSWKNYLSKILLNK